MKKKRIHIYWKVIIGLIVFIALCYCFSMMDNINHRMNESATYSLLNTTKVIESNLENYIEKDFETLHIIGEIYKRGNNLDSQEFLSLYKTMGLEWAGIIVTDSNNSEIKDTFDVTKKPWYNQWKRKEKGYSKAYYGTSGRLQTTLWIPIYDDNKLIATVFGDVLLKKYYSANVFTFYNGNGRSYLFDRCDGSWILKSLGTDGLPKRENDIYSLLIQSGNDSEDVKNFQEAVKKRQTGTAEFNFNGEKAYICFMPLSSSSDWYITTVIAKKVLLKESNQVQSMIRMIFAVFCLSILTFTIAFIRWQNKQIKFKEAKYREALFANISSNIDSAFLIYDKMKKESVFVSDNVKRLLGLERDWLKEDAGNLFDWCKVEKKSASRIAFLNGTLDKPIVQEICIENELGVKERYVRLELIPADIDQEIAVLTDITKDKDIQNSLIDAMQRAESASRAKNEFLSAMSHDIRTPMNGVIGMTAIASAHLDDKERIRDCLSKINEASAHLLSLINEILDMSRIESGKMELLEEPFNIAQLLQEVLNMNYPGIKQKNHTIRVHFHSLDHEQVIGDPVRLQRIVTNLISNAIKYTPNGGTITLSLYERNQEIKEYGCYEFTIQDNGIGMSEEFQKVLFEPFSREQEVQNKKIQGTGLGMSIVKNIVNLMMGDINVISEKNKGTTFKVKINLKLDDDGKVSGESLYQLPVLVVDDDMVICETVTKMLCDIGMAGEWSDNGTLAVKKVAERHDRKEDYKAVLLDWKMPDMDGIETARHIREKVDMKVPIIILTAYDWSEIEEDAIEAGVDAFLSKPIYKSKLVHKLTKLIHDTYDNSSLKQEEINKDISAGKRILIVEDNPLNREIAVELLNILGLEVDTAEDGEKAVECFVKNEPGTYDLIFMDIQMPKMNGYEATKEIRKKGRSDSKTIPIIAMTADAFAHDIQAAHAAGMNEHISKPVSIERIKQVLEKFLNETIA